MSTHTANTPPTNYVNHAVCRKCGGRCCKFTPGATVPADWGNDPAVVRAAVVAALRSQKWVVIDSRTNGPCVRPAMDSLTDHCIFLTATGCSLSDDKRPYECRMLEPRLSDDVQCKAHCRGKTECAEAWGGYDLYAMEDEAYERTPTV